MRQAVEDKLKEQHHQKYKWEFDKEWPFDTENPAAVNDSNSQ